MWFKIHFAVKASPKVAGWDAWITQFVTSTRIWPTHWVEALHRELQHVPLQTIRSYMIVSVEVTCLQHGISGLLLLRMLCAMPTVQQEARDLLMVF